MSVLDKLLDAVKLNDDYDEDDYLDDDSSYVFISNSLKLTILMLSFISAATIPWTPS